MLGIWGAICTNREGKPLAEAKRVFHVVVSTNGGRERTIAVFLYDVAPRLGDPNSSLGLLTASIAFEADQEIGPKVEAKVVFESASHVVIETAEATPVKVTALIAE